jgi:toxin CcdB
MAQYDVYPNPTPAARAGFPYLVDLQSAQLSRLPTRLVMPLQRLPRAPEGLPRRLVQTVEVQGEALYLAAHQCAAVPAGLLRRRVASVAGQVSIVIDALDAVVSGV